MQKKKGISLIVLVITIIVMIILAASVVITLNNTGVIDKASTAVDLTNESQVQDLAAIVWADAYMDDLRGQDLIDEVKEKLEAQGVKEEEWNITVTDTGISVISKNSLSGLGNSLFNSISGSNYGDSITFSTDLNGNGNTTDDWKVFYKNEDYLYIISAGYLPNSYVPSSLKTVEDYINTSGTYGIGFSINANDYDEQGNLIYNVPAQINNSVAQKYMFSWWLQEECNGSTNPNARAIALLLNTDAWTDSLVSSELKNAGVEAIGTSTIDMFLASVTGKYGGTYNFSYSNVGGYTSANCSLDLANITPDDRLYAPYPDGGYDEVGNSAWFAAPGGYGEGETYEIETLHRWILQFGGLYGGDMINNYYGIRPVISIPASLVAGTIDDLKVSK